MCTTDKANATDIEAKCCFSLIFSIIAFVISILLLFPCYPRIIKINENHQYDLGFDYLGLIVGILAILVTALMGWNIYQLIDMKNIKKSIKRESNYLHNKVDYNSAFMYGRISQMIASSLTNIGKKERKIEMLHSAIISVKMFSNLSSGIEYNSILNTMIETMKATPNIHFSENEIEELILAIGEIPNRTNLSLLDDLITEIRNCKPAHNKQ